jgi:hypothetical protein
MNTISVWFIYFLCHNVKGLPRCYTLNYSQREIFNIVFVGVFVFCLHTGFHMYRYVLWFVNYRHVIEPEM